jgi:phage shock protein C
MSERLYRSNGARLIGGVCSGLAEYFAVRVVLLRLAFVLWTLASTIGGVVYLILWMILPEKGTHGYALGERMRRNADDMREQAERWYRDLRDTLGAKDSPDVNQIQRATMLGSAVAGLGVVLLIDSLHLLAPFRLKHLEPLALVLLGIVFVKRAL